MSLLCFDASIKCRFSLLSFYVWSARILVSCTLPHFPKDHISRKICIKLENFQYGRLDIFRPRNFIEGKVFYMRTIGYFTDPVLII